MASEKLVARKGRLRQRYDNEYRLVAGCVPYRVDKDGQLEVLMVSTANRDDLVFPKGGWEDDEDVYEAACREALEEAGVRGNINRNPLGLWVFRSKSRQSLSQSSDSPRGACKGHVFALEVTEELKQWPEQETHGRRWLSPADAYGLCRYDWMREALTALLDLFHGIVADPCSGGGGREHYGAGTERARWHVHKHDADEIGRPRGSSGGAVLILAVHADELTTDCRRS